MDRSAQCASILAVVEPNDDGCFTAFWIRHVDHAPRTARYGRRREGVFTLVHNLSFMRQRKELYGFLVTSTVRLAILRTLNHTSPLLQAEIARSIGRRQQDIAREVRLLEEAGLLECLTPNKRAYKAYVITPLGREILAYRP